MRVALGVRPDGRYFCPRHWPDERCTADCRPVRIEFTRAANALAVYWRERARGVPPKREVRA